MNPYEWDFTRSALWFWPIGKVVFADHETTPYERWTFQDLTFDFDPMWKSHIEHMRGENIIMKVQVVKRSSPKWLRCVVSRSATVWYWMSHNWRADLETPLSHVCSATCECYNFVCGSLCVARECACVHHTIAWTCVCLCLLSRYSLLFWPDHVWHQFCCSNGSTQRHCQRRYCHPDGFTRRCRYRWRRRHVYGPVSRSHPGDVRDPVSTHELSPAWRTLRKSYPFVGSDLGRNCAQAIWVTDFAKYPYYWIRSRRRNCVCSIRYFPTCFT